MDQARARRIERLDDEALLADEEPGQPREPLQLARRTEGHDPRPQPQGAARAVGLNEHVELGASRRLARDARHERVPLRITPEVGKHLPDALRRRVDLDHSEEFGEQHQAVPSIMCGTVRCTGCATGAGRFGAGARDGTTTRNQAA